MKPDEPTRKPVDAGNTRDMLDQTIGSDVRGGDDPDATMMVSDSSSGGGSGSSKYGEAVGDWIGPYRLVEEIGSGGMGTVYRAEQLEPVKREVALKIIKAGMDTDQVIARFEAERQALSMMEHSNIARVLDAGATDKGRPYFVMELVRGKPVTKFSDEHKMSIEKRLELFIRICDAIQHAHQKGIIHRDLKPSNILVSMQDQRAIPKIIDFGVAKATKHRLTEKTMHTQQGQVVGTLEYMSPEQAQMTDANVDTRTDIYSLGVVLYELLTGNTPLNRQSISKLGYLEILNRIKDQEAQKPSSRLTDATEKLNNIAASRNVEPRKLFNTLRGDLDWIVLKALDKEPARRYETAAGLADDVERYLNAEPIDARPPTNLYLIGKFAKRHKVAVTAGALVVASLIAGIVLATSQMLRAQSAEAVVAKQIVELQKRLDLEKENAQLQQQMAQKDEAAKSDLATEIRIYSGFGQWQNALDVFDRYQTEFGDPPLDVGILRLNALDGLAAGEKLREEVRKLESHPDAGKFQAQLNLWRGYVFLGGNDQATEARSLISAAIASGELSESDQLFAEGLVDESLTNAINKYGRALEISPFHAQARMQMLITLIMLGRYEEAQQQIVLGETIFPDDQRFQFASTVSHALANKPMLASQSLREMRRQNVPESSLKNIRALGRLARSVNNQFTIYDREGLLDWFSIIRQGLPLFQETAYRAIPVPQFQKERVFQAYGEFANSFLNPLMKIAREKKKHRLMIDNCQNAWNIHQDGMFKCFEAWSWFALEEYQKSAECFTVAANADGLFPEIKNHGLFGAFISKKWLFETTGDSERMIEAMEYLEKYVSTDFESHRATEMFKTCAQVGRWDLARAITDEMIRREGGFKRNWLTVLLDEADQRNNLGLALSVCDEILADSPESALVQKKRVEIMERIAAASKAGDE